MRAQGLTPKAQQRAAKQRQRELERASREIAKLSALEQARLEVESFDNSIEVLLSVHKEQAEPTDWQAHAASIRPVSPIRESYYEQRARLRLTLDPLSPDANSILAQAHEHDEAQYQEILEAHYTRMAEWEKWSALARRVLSGEIAAYIEAIEETNPFSELAGIGSSMHFTGHNRRVVEIGLRTNARQAIPTEIKTLTSAGKVSTKTMPRARFVELYQDFVSGCVLRVARELFALLPVDTILITASVEAMDSATGHTAERPFLSVVIERAILDTLNFDQIDPSDALMALPHRGDLKASRKTGEFEYITPLTIADLGLHEAAASRMNFDELWNRAKRCQDDLAAKCAALDAAGDETPSLNEEPS